MSLKKYRFLLEPGPQVAFAIIMTMAFCFVALVPLYRFDCREPYPEFTPFIPSQLTQFGEETHLVKTGIYADAFPVFEMVNNSFTIDATVWFEFDPNVVPLKSISNFSFERGTIIEKSEPDSALVGSDLRVQYQVRVKFTSDLDHHRFPLGDHRIFLVLTNNIFSSKEVIFQAMRSGFTTNPNIDPGGWTLLNRSANAGFNSKGMKERRVQNEHSYPRVVYAFDFKKPGFREALTIIIPLFLIYLLGIFALIIRSEKDSATALSLSIGSISGLLAYRFVVESVSPRVGYLLVSDYLHLVFFTATFIVFLRCAYAHAVTTRRVLDDKDANSSSLEAMNFTFYYVLQILVLIATMVIVTR